MNKNVVIGLIVVAVIGIVGYQVGASGGGGAALEPIPLDGIENDTVLANLAQPVTMGSPDAPVTIIEFGDYQCPGCMNFNQTVKPQIDLALIESGEAKFSYYDYPLSMHPWAFLAARAARCADDQGEYWSYHDALFVNQSRWSPSGVPPVGDFEDYAADVGMNRGQFSDCLRSDRHADVVTANLNLAMRLGVGSTPTVMVTIAGGPARQVAEPSFLSIQSAIASLRQEMAGNAGGAGN